MNLKVDVNIDGRIRDTAAALLLTKFVAEQKAYRWHLLKERTLDHLEHVAARMHPFAELVRRLSDKWWMHSFYSIAVLLDNAGDAYRVPEALSQQIPELTEQNYAELFWDFQLQADLDQLWHQTREDWQQCVQDCRVLLEEADVELFLNQFYGGASRGLAVVPNPLDPAAFGFAPSNAQSCYSIVGPPAIEAKSAPDVRYAAWGTKLAELVVHEFSHALFGAARGGRPDLANRTDHLADRMNLRGYFPRMYNTWESQLDELDIRAIETVYLKWKRGPPAAQARIRSEEDSYGLSLLAPMYNALERYFAARRTGKSERLSDFLPDLVEEMETW